jgi:hypothetical protein
LIARAALIILNQVKIRERKEKTLFTRARVYCNCEVIVNLRHHFTSPVYQRFLRLVPFLVPLLLILGCGDNSTEPADNLTKKPVVKKSSTDYNYDSFRDSFPDTSSLKRIGKAYAGIYSEEIKNELISYMKRKVKQIGEDENLFTECFGLTGCSGTASVSLPTYAEKAKYEGKEAWIIQLVWGIDPQDLSHYKCFAFETDKMDTLDYYRCY